MEGWRKLYNFYDGPALPRPKDVRYRLWIAQTVEHESGGTMEHTHHEDHKTLADALRAAARFVQDHGGFESWDECYGRVQSGWMEHHWDDCLVSYTLWVEKITERRVWRDRGGCLQIVGCDIRERELRLTMKRLAAVLQHASQVH